MYNPPTSVCVLSPSYFRTWIQLPLLHLRYVGATANCQSVPLVAWLTQVLYFYLFYKACRHSKENYVFSLPFFQLSFLSTYTWNKILLFVESTSLLRMTPLQGRWGKEWGPRRTMLGNTRFIFTHEKQQSMRQDTRHQIKLSWGATPLVGHPSGRLPDVPNQNLKIN